MWPVNDWMRNEDEQSARGDAVDAAEEAPEETPADAEERMPEEAGYGYGV
jgi:hypothetical protein